MAFNSWNVRYRFFEAEDKNAVIAMRPQLCKWVEEEELEIARRNGVDPGETPDARVIVDEVASVRADGSLETAEDIEVIEPDVDEFNRPDDLPTGYDSRCLVIRMAELDLLDVDLAELRRLIKEARVLCGQENI